MTEKEIKALANKINRCSTDRDVAVACFNYLLKWNRQAGNEIITFEDSKDPNSYFLVDAWSK